MLSKCPKTEIAHPERTFETGAEDVKEPDPQGRILRDNGQFIRVETAVVPDTRGEGVSARVHVLFRPNPANKAHWNNEAGSMLFWVSPPAGWRVSQRLVTLPSPPGAVSTEPREAELEVRGPQPIRVGSVILSAYALYYVCEDVNGVCMYRRQDVPIIIGPHK